MAPKRKSSRRDFLKGRAAGRALQDLADQAGSHLAAPESSDEAVAGGRAASYLVQISRRAMAVEFQVYLNAAESPDAPEAALEALDIVEGLENQMTVFRDDSEMAGINRRAASESVAVEPQLFTLLQQALTLSSETDGAFDITAGPLSKLWGFHRRQGRFPGKNDVKEALGTVGSRWVELDSEQRTIHFHRPGVEVNLNAIGKGYALDRCTEMLRDSGIDNFLIHGGQSSILAAGSRACGDQAKPGWTVALRHPLRPDKRMAEIRLHDRALGTSGSGVQFFHYKGRRYGHVLDPRTGWPAEGVLSATVIAPTAAQADALSTAFYVMGLEKAEEYCAEHEEVAAIMVCPGERKGSVVVHPIGLKDEDWTQLGPDMS